MTRTRVFFYGGGEVAVTPTQVLRCFGLKKTPSNVAEAKRIIADATQRNLLEERGGRVFPRWQ